MNPLIRMLIFSVVILLMGQTDMNHFLIAAKEEQMTNGEYVFISIDADPGILFIVCRMNLM